MISLVFTRFWSSDEEMEEANPVEANDSDYDPNKEAKKEVRDDLISSSSFAFHLI